MKRGWALLALCLAGWVAAEPREATLSLADGTSVRYAILDSQSPSPPSARDAAQRVLRHLAAGEIEEAAVLSNAPKRRYEVLHEYRAAVGETEFKRVFSQYLFPENPLVAEIALGPRRLLIWRLGEAGNRLAAQYYVQVEGRFLIDDVPGEERARLARVLEAYRAGNAPGD